MRKLFAVLAVLAVCLIPAAVLAFQAQPEGRAPRAASQVQAPLGMPAPLSFESLEGGGTYELPEVRVSASRPKPEPAKRYECGKWKPSLIGGQYRACEWK